MPARKRTESTKKVVKKPAEENIVEAIPESSPIGMAKKNKKILLGLIIVLIIALLYYFKGLFVVASVNGQFISRLQIIKELEKQYGKQAMEAQITKILIMQEAKKENVTVDRKDIDKEITTIENNLKEQGATLDEALALRGMSKQDLIDQITLQKTVEKVVSKDVKITDKDVDSYIEQNKITIPEGSNPQDLRTKVKAQLQQQKMGEKAQEWVAGLQKKAKITYFIKY